MEIFYLTDGRDRIYQWDTNRYIYAKGAQEIHYVQSSTQMDVAVTDNRARVPDEMLQSNTPIKVYAYVTENGNFTLKEKIFDVVPREKPTGYIYTPTEVLNFEQLQKQIGDLEDLSTETKENLVSAINEIIAGGGASDWDDLNNKPFETLGRTLKAVNGVLDVNTSTAVEQDNTLPITSAAVYTEVGNINALLGTI